MIIVNTHRLTQWLSLIVLVLIAPLVQSIGGEGAFWPGVWSVWMIPLILLAEVAIHMSMLMSQRQVHSAIPAAVVTAGLVAVRAACCFAGALLLWLFQQGIHPLGIQFANHWMGSPFALALQMIVIALALPVALHSWAPGFLNENSLTRLGKYTTDLSGQLSSAKSEPKRQEAHAADHAQSAAMQPFIYEFEELERYYNKVIGLEGFVILSNEGLIIWERMPWRDQSAAMSGRLARWLMSCSSISTPRPLSKLDTATVQAHDRWAVAVTICDGATLVLFFTERLSTTQVAQTTPRLAEAARSLFAYRYGGTKGDAHAASPQHEEEGSLPWSLSLKI